VAMLYSSVRLLDFLRNNKLKIKHIIALSKLFNQKVEQRQGYYHDGHFVFKTNNAAKCENGQRKAFES